MTILKASDAPVGIGRGKPNSADTKTERAPQAWVRPSDWLTFTIPEASEQKVIGNVAIFDTSSNYIAFVMTVTGGYTVDWGDGTTTTHSSGAQADKNYVWEDISSETLTSRGYRQAVITITPTTAGATFSTVNLGRRYTIFFNTNYSNPWLDIAVAAPNASAIVFSHSTSGTSIAQISLAEQIRIVSHNVTSMGYMFFNCISLQSVPLFDTSSVTTITNMFASCRSLQSVPLFDTSSVTSMSYMFNGCSSLQSVPLFDTSSVTTMQNMFASCSSLQSVPLFDTSSVTNMSGMFNGCSSLQSVPLFDTSSVTTMQSMFNDCFSLQSVPLFDTSSVTNMSGMFSDCFSLQRVPLFDTSSVTTMASMFSNCSSLQSVPLFDTSSVTTMQNMFASCRSLQSLPELDLSKIATSATNSLSVGSTSTSFSSASLRRVKITGNRWTQSLQNCSLDATALDEFYTNLPALNPAITNVTSTGSAVTYTVGTTEILPFVAGRTVTITGVDPAAYNLTSVSIASVDLIAGTFTVNNAATGTYVSGGVATIQDNKTITVTSNPGVAADDSTIATNKGWTVVG
jgi:surface protein